MRTHCIPYIATLLPSFLVPDELRIIILILQPSPDNFAFIYLLSNLGMSRKSKHVLYKTAGARTMRFLVHLPSELFLIIVAFLGTERDINSLCQTNRHFHTLLNPYLYRVNSRNSSSALVWAAKQGSEATARMSIQEGAEVGWADHSGRTPLSWARGVWP